MFSSWLPPQASTAASEIDRLFYLTSALTGGFFLLVMGVLLYSVLRFRFRGAGDLRPARHVHGTWRQELVWAAVPGLFLVFLAVVSERTWARLRTRPTGAERALVVEVLAQQFAWNVRYPGADNRFGRTDSNLYSEANPFGLDPADQASTDDVVLMNELYLPVNRPARLILRSRDVIHGLYLPEFRLQQNVLPGAALDFWLQPTRTGTYEILCNQFCGLAHYRMRGTLTVGDEPGLEPWLRARQAGGRAEEQPHGT